MAGATPRDESSPPGPAGTGDGEPDGLHRPLAPVLWLSLAILAVAPFFSEEAAGRIATTLLVGGTALVALRRSDARRATLLLGEVLVGTATLAAVGARELGGADSALLSVATGLVCVLLLITPGVIVYRTARRPRITLDTVAGLLAAYIQIGLFFAALYQLTDDLDRGAFFEGVADPAVMDFQFFSFVTLTTLGYGDLVPATSLGQSLAVYEAILGQVFLVTVVALAVGNLGASLPRARLRGGDGPTAGDQAAPR